MDPSESPSADPSPSVELTNPTADKLQKALETAGVTIIVMDAGGDGSDLDTDSYTVQSGQTLIIQSGTFTVGADQFLSVDGALSNSGTLELAGSLDVSGTLTNTNTGTVIFMAATDPTGDSIRFGSIQLLMGSFENSGDFAVTEMGQFTCMGGTYSEHRTDQLYAMVENDDGFVYWLAPAGEMPVWNDCTIVTLLGAKEGVIKALPPVTASGVTLDLNGRQISLASALTVAVGEYGPGELTIIDSSQSGVLQSLLTDGSPTISVAGGSLTVSGGTIISDSGPVYSDDGTLISGGAAILVSSGSVEIIGGTVQGVAFGIKNESGSTETDVPAVTISGGTVILTAENPKESKYLAVYGPFAFEGGTLMAKNPACLFDMEPTLNGKELLKETTDEDGDGYYRATTLTP